MNIFTLIFLFFDIAIIILNFNLTAIIIYTVVFLIFFGLFMYFKSDN